MVSLRLVETDSSGAELTSLPIRSENPQDSYPIACGSFDTGHPAVRESVEDTTDADGVNDLTMYHGSRTVTLDLTLLGPQRAEYEQKLRALSLPRKRIWLYINRPEWSGERRMLLRPNNLSFISDRAAAARFKVQMAFTCASGRMEALQESHLGLNARQVSTNGFKFPIKFPVTFGNSGANQDIKTLTNAGNAPVLPFIEIYGYVNSPRIINRTTGERMEFTANGGLRVDLGHWLAVDVGGKRTLMDADPNDSRYRNLNFSTSSWMTLAPGANEIEFSATSVGTGARVDIYYRPSWI